MTETTPDEAALLARLRQQPPADVEVSEVLAVIEAGYDYTPTSFNNGVPPDQAHNAAGTNEVSCRLFAFARLHGLAPTETLACFGHYYREQVLPHPDGNDHANIRTFMRHGWSGLQFDGEALRPRQP